MRPAARVVFLLVAGVLSFLAGIFLVAIYPEDAKVFFDYWLSRLFHVPQSMVGTYVVWLLVAALLLFGAVCVVYVLYDICRAAWRWLKWHYDLLQSNSKDPSEQEMELRIYEHYARRYDTEKGGVQFKIKSIRRNRGCRFWVSNMDWDGYVIIERVKKEVHGNYNADYSKSKYSEPQ